MTEQVVKYGTARLAKYLGFDWWCSRYYYKEGKDYISGFNNKNSLNNENEVSTPTQSLLQKWLRDVHKIIVIPEILYHDNEEGWNTYGCNIFFGNIGLTLNFFTTYEEALEAGLLKGLKQINNE